MSKRFLQRAVSVLVICAVILSTAAFPVGAERDFQAEIDALVQEFAMLKEPQSGIYQNFLSFVYHKNAYRDTINFKMQELALLKQQRRELQEHFKIYNIEYEKAKYLDNTEIKKMLDKAKKQEGRDLDEISVMLYANRNS